MGCLSRVQFGKKKVIGYYCGTLMYGNLYDDKYSDRNHGELVMSVSARKLMNDT